MERAGPDSLAFFPPTTKKGFAPQMRMQYITAHADLQINRDKCEKLPLLKLQSRLAVSPHPSGKTLLLVKRGLLKGTPTMKWFKHESAAVKDEKIQALMSEFGIAGYGIYFILCELCAEKIDQNLKPEIRIKWPYLEHLTHSRRATIARVLAGCATAGLLMQESNDYEVVCSIPNLLKRLDNHTKNLQAAGNKVSVDKEQEEEQDKEQDKEVMQKRRKNGHIPDKDFIEFLRQSPAYKGINIDNELSKMDVWLLAHPGRLKTKRFITLWLNRIDRGVAAQPSGKKGHNLNRTQTENMEALNEFLRGKQEGAVRPEDLHQGHGATFGIVPSRKNKP